MSKERLDEGGDLDEDQLMNALQDQGVIENIMANLQFNSSPTPVQQQGSKPVKPATHFINKEPQFDMKHTKKGWSFKNILKVNLVHI